ncbi:MAG: hypothetical protein RIF32_20595 [Leptospirales bacterium]|jgi:hypothetical protein
MARLQLEYSEIISGDRADFSPLNRAKRSLLLVFQVNCPGCFMYALPIAAGLHRDLISADVRILGLSTAFEDFDLNTPENTRALVQEKRLVGEARRVLAGQGLNQAPFDLEFPIAFDRLKPPGEFSAQVFQRLAEAQPGFDAQAPEQRPDFIERVHKHYIKQPVLPATFTMNLLPGTPSWIVFDESGQILFQDFGQPRDLNAMLASLLPETSAGK